MNSTNVFTLDVRPLLQAGTEPMTAILRAKTQLAPEQTLRLLAPFEPRPLYTLFESDGYHTQSRQIDENDWEILFIPTGEVAVSAAPTQENELDYRGQPPQDWLRQALEAISYLGREDNLVLHSSERPEALIAELNTTTTDYDSEADGHQHWITTIWRL